jgi:transposase-like protein
MTEPTSAQELFKGRHFDQEIIVLCVRWYLTFKLSSRDLVQVMAERGIALTHTTILRWVQRYVPEFEKRWSRYARPVGNSWRVDETYLKIKGQWVYLYRAVDKAGRTVDFLLSKRRDVAAAKRFFSRATKQHGVPRVITLDGYAASHRAVAKLKADLTKIRSEGENQSQVQFLYERLPAPKSEGRALITTGDGESQFAAISQTQT